MTRSLIARIAIAVLLFGSSAATSGEAHWSYSGAQGPDQWAKLSPKNAACAGMNQSPIDLTGFIEADLAPLEFSYRAGGDDVVNNGHTVQVGYAKGSTVTVDGIPFELVQFHFHAPSENLIEGKSFPLEAHFVHADRDGNLAVVALLFTEGAENPALAEIGRVLPKKEGEKERLSPPFAAEVLLPADRDYYRYSGSLTTPPCTEGVRWLVLKQSVTASSAQIDAFSRVLHEHNNRPVQPVHGRPVLK
jgi:carbonic anhydrase